MGSYRPRHAHMTFTLPTELFFSFLQDPNQMKEALENGASMAGGAELIQQVDHADRHSVNMCHYEGIVVY